MSEGLAIRLRADGARIDASDLFRGEWRGMAPADLARRTVRVERAGIVAAGDLFDIGGSPGEVAHLEGNLSAIDRVGAELNGGTIVVHGAVGDEVGMKMTAGRIEVVGNAGRGAGLAMAGGALLVTGDVGPRAGGAPAGIKRGMTGGELIVRGSAGEETGAGMRRGVIAIQGNAGAYAGLSMIAGTVVVFGTAAAGAGQFSKRGSIVALGAVQPPATYRYACTFQPVHLRLLLHGLQRRWAVPVTDAHMTGFYRRFSGDFAEFGRGEILAWTGS